jgi:capsid protein
VQGSLDPLKEAKAAVLLIQNGLKTHGQVAREMGGGDWDENVEVLADENRRLEAAGGSSRQEINLNDTEGDEGNA